MLASVQRITKVEKHSNADTLDICTVLGWRCITKLGQFKEGELAVYIAIDTILPEVDEFEFMRERKWRLKTIKLRSELSQGLLVPLYEVATIHAKLTGKLDVNITKLKEGDDVSELIGVRKYEKPDNNPLERYEKPRMPKSGWAKWKYILLYNYLYKWFPRLRNKQRSPFPTQLVSITDEERIQNMPQVLKSHQGKEFILSYKLDGSSITIIHEKGFLGRSKYRVCSRRFELHDKNNDWWRVFQDTDFQKYIKDLVEYYNTDDIIVQGETIGRFNGNHHKLSKDEIRLFNIYVKGKRLDQAKFYELCELFNIPVCPLYKRIVLDHSLEELLKMSEIKDFINPEVEAEGLVWRCVDDLTSWKVINNKYLLSEK